MNRITVLASVALIAVLLSANNAKASLMVTNTSNITLANSQTESGGDLTDNPNVVNVPPGLLVPYTASSSSGDLVAPFGVGGAFGTSNLSDGDVGVGNFSDGTYGIPNNNGTLTLAFGGTKTVTSIAIYDGYSNRDDGSYILRDAATNILGAWTISSDVGNSNSGVDSFWLTFNTPVTTSALTISHVTSDITPSYREIQVFQADAVVPEPSTFVLAGLGLLGLGFVALRKKYRRA